MESFIEFGREVVVLGLGGVFAFLVAEMGAHHVHFYKRSEHTRRLPLDVVSSNNYKYKPGMYLSV